MASPLTLRLNKKMRQRITRIARRKQLTTSEAIRQAIEDWATRQEPIHSPYEAIADLIGVAHGGDPGLSSQTGRRFTNLLKKRRSRR
jgi:predicted DNA-binding protein